VGEDRSLCEGCKHCIAITVGGSVLCSVLYARLGWIPRLRYCRFYKPREGGKEG
jgi:hypothetical protein